MSSLQSRRDAPRQPMKQERLRDAFLLGLLFGTLAAVLGCTIGYGLVFRALGCSVGHP